MNPTSPTPAPQPRPPRPKLVIPGLTFRDIILGAVIAVAILGFVALAIFSIGSGPKNLITGVVRKHLSTGEREVLLNVSTKGVKETTADTGYSLKVWVESEKREYEVMVEKSVWEKKKDGDTIEFLRPKSEQR